MESDGAGTTRLRGGPGSHGQCPANRSAGSGSGGWKCELPVIQAAPPVNVWVPPSDWYRMISPQDA